MDLLISTVTVAAVSTSNFLIRKVVAHPIISLLLLTLIVLIANKDRLYDLIWTFAYMLLLQLWYVVCWMGREIGEITLSAVRVDEHPEHSPDPYLYEPQVIYETVVEKVTEYVDKIEYVKITEKQWYDDYIGQFYQELLMLLGLILFVIIVIHTSYMMVFSVFKITKYMIYRYKNVKTKVKLHYVPTSAFEPEKMINGSEFVTSPNPKIQCEIWASYEKDGLYTEFKPVAQAWRYNHYIITAYHAVSDAHKIKLRSKEAMVEIDVGRFKSIGGDIAFAMITPMEIGSLKLASAKFPVSTTQKVLVTVTAFGKKSRGFVKPYDAFGYLQYDGSTIKGFSGAPYMLTPTMVLGMHVGGHTLNVGYDASYLKALFSRIEESSQDPFNFGRDDVFEMHQSPFNSEEYDVKVTSADGTVRYHIMDEEDLAKHSIRKRMRRFRESKYEKESLNPLYEFEPPKSYNMQLADQGNYLSPAVNVSVAGPSEIKEDVAPISNKPIFNETISLEDHQQKINTDHHSSTPAQPNSHLEDMLKILQLAQDCRHSRKSREQFVRLFLDLSNGDLVQESHRSRSGSRNNLKRGLRNLTTKQAPGSAN